MGESGSGWTEVPESSCEIAVLEKVRNDVPSIPKLLARCEAWTIWRFNFPHRDLTNHDSGLVESQLGTPVGIMARSFWVPRCWLLEVL